MLDTSRRSGRSEPTHQTLPKGVSQLLVPRPESTELLASSNRHPGSRRVKLNAIHEGVLVYRPGVRGAPAQRLAVGLAGSPDVLPGDCRERDKLDGVHLDLTWPNPVAAALLDPWPRPQSDRERDVSGQHVVAQLAAELDNPNASRPAAQTPQQRSPTNGCCAAPTTIKMSWIPMRTPPRLRPCSSSQLETSSAACPPTSRRPRSPRWRSRTTLRRRTARAAGSRR